MPLLKIAENKILNTLKLKYGMRMLRAFFFIKLRIGCELALVCAKSMPDKRKNNGIWNEEIHLFIVADGKLVCPKTTNRIPIPFAMSI